MMFKTEEDAIEWVRFNIPFAVLPKGKAKTKFIYPFKSYHAQMQIVEYLGKALFKQQKVSIFTKEETDYLLTLCNHNKDGKLYSPENKQVIKKLKKL